MGSVRDDWDYSKLHGPETWSSHWHIGHKQSPIDIRANELVHNPELGKHPLHIDERAVCFQVKNLGVNVSAAYLKSSAEPLVLSGGPLKHNYQFREMHLHWGSHDAKGSEHTIGGKSYSAEMHLVHWNRDLYTAEGEAIKSPNGLSVLGVLLDASGSHTNAHFEKILDMFEQVRFKDEVHAGHTDLNPYNILPANRGVYYTYEGSLTTPPCFESVTWIVFAEPVKISPAQLARLRRLKAVVRSKGECDQKHDPMVIHTECRCARVPTICDNYRPVMELNGRKVMASAPVK